jgi:copper chaperone
MMETEKIIIANLKCSGCENTIKNRLSEIEGVESVIVNHEEDSVTITHSGKAKREDFTKKLHSIGYPEATEENGLLLQLKSYASCMIGRINK